MAVSGKGYTGSEESKGVSSIRGVHFTSHTAAHTENGGCVRDSAGNWMGVIRDGRIGLELGQAYERDVLKRTR